MQRENSLFVLALVGGINIHLSITKEVGCGIGISFINRSNEISGIILTCRCDVALLFHQHFTCSLWNTKTQTIVTPDKGHIEVKPSTYVPSDVPSILEVKIMVASRVHNDLSKWYSKLAQCETIFAHQFPPTNQHPQIQASQILQQFRTNCDRVFLGRLLSLCILVKRIANPIANSNDILNIPKSISSKVLTKIHSGIENNINLYVLLDQTTIHLLAKIQTFLSFLVYENTLSNHPITNVPQLRVTKPPPHPTFIRHTSSHLATSLHWRCRRFYIYF